VSVNRSRPAARRAGQGDRLLPRRKYLRLGLKVVCDQGEEAIWYGLDLCEDWHFELFHSARTGNTRRVASL
jgi:hypothetical protein